MELEEINTFFSWQSDIRGQSEFIRNALSSASLAIEENNDTLKIINEEATRNNSGSPNIATTILGKIKRSDIFIADVSIVNSEADHIRLMSNPNVMFELGFAVAHLGWDRIILLNNNKFSSIDNLPFDIRNHRTTCFSAELFNNSEKGNLKSNLNEAISLILSKNPNRDIEKIIKTKDMIRIERDIKELKCILTEIDFSEVLGEMEFLPYNLNVRVDFYFEFAEKYFFNNFELYDKELEKNFEQLFLIYNLVVPSPTYYESNNTPYYQLKPDSLPQEFLNDLSENLIRLREIILEIKTIIRNKYIEIDLDETNYQARKAYIERHSTNDIS